MEPLPSQFLTPLQPRPSLETISELLAKLREQLLPEEATVDLRELLTPRASEIGAGKEDKEDEDTFELEFVRGWVGRVVQLASRQLASGAEGEWEDVVEDAASLVAALAGDCATSGSSTIYKLPLSTEHERTPPAMDVAADRSTESASPPPTRAISPGRGEGLSITIRSTTLTASSTGFRTWSSASILAAKMATYPLAHFGESPSAAIVPLRVLELGSGTGLAGLTAAAVLASLDRSADVHLTDYDGPALDNLAHNIAANALPAPSASLVSRKAFRLDWADIARGGGSPPPQRYDVILGADLVYEPEQLAMLHPTVAALLRFPTDGLSDATFFFVLPVRPTHHEHIAVDRAFSRSEQTDQNPGTEFRSRTFSDINGKMWVLRAVEREEVSVDDGFAGKVNGGLRRHLLYRIRWIECTA